MAFNANFCSAADIIDPAQPIDWTWSPNQGTIARYLCLPGGVGSKGNVWKNLDRKIGNDGTLTNITPSAASGFVGAQGRPGGWGALAFDGSNDYVNCGGTSVAPYTTGFSLSAWVNPSGGVGASRGIISHGNASYYLRLSSSNNLQLVRSQQADITNGTATYSVGAWHQGFAVFDASGNVQLYTDGVVDGSSAAAGLSAPSFNLYIGSDDNNGNASEFMNGLLDDICIWNRALSATEIAALYNDSKTGYQRSLRRLSPWSLGVTAAAPPSGVFSPWWYYASAHEGMMGG